MISLAPVISVLRARWFWSLVGAIILSLLIWFFGDLLRVGEFRPLGGPVARLVGVLAITVGWSAWNLLVKSRARRSNEEFVAALAEPVGKTKPASAEIAELERRFAGALERLKRSRLGEENNRRWLYQLPWYVMIGPPGSGKSTALAQSGLSLQLGQIQELRGVGGTRYCDWVFTDDAVLLDTAGRWVLQDSDPEADKTAWLGFLDLLKKQRPQRPLNGVLVTLAANDLMQENLEQTTRIRARLEEIEARLGMRLPVYLLITKADLIAGFEPFFGDLNETQREQVWGHTFDHRPAHPDTPDVESLRKALGELVARLDRRLPERLTAEADIKRRAEIFGFPAQVARLTDDIARFVERCFRPTALEDGAWLRGVYLTSGTQVGTPIDRLMTAIGRSIGVALPRPAPVRGDRSFFLRHLLEDVVFGEARLAGHNVARERRERLMRQAVLASLALAMVGAVAAWSWSFAGNRARYGTLEAELGVWAQQVQPVARTRLTPADADFTVVLPALSKLADLKAELEPGDPVSLRMGLSQRSTIEEQLGAAYRSALIRLLLPRLVLAAERGLRAHLQDSDYLVDGLKVDLALGGGAPVEPALLDAWFALEAQARSPQAVGPTRRHVAALAKVLPELDSEARPTLDAGLLADARAVLVRTPLSKRAYTMLISNPAVRQLPGWRVPDHVGPNASSTLVRRSGRPLGTELPAIFTYDGFHQVFLPLLDEFARGAFAEFWVLSGRSTAEPSDADIQKLRADMLRLYYDDAIAAWDELLRDVTLTPITSLDQAVEATKSLSGPNSPLKLLVQAVVRETALTVPPEPAKAGEQEREKVLKTVRTLNVDRDRLTKLIRPGTGYIAPAEVPGAPVEAHYTYLRQLVEGVNGARPAIDEALAALADVHAKLAEAVNSPNPGDVFRRMNDAWATQLSQAAQRLPEPLKQMLDSMARKAADLRKSGALQQLNAVWRSDVLPSCRALIGDRFPFAAASSKDANTEDVAKVLGPTGLLQNFVKTELANFVDATRQTWQDSQSIGLKTASLAQLARAQQITRALFPGGAGPKASFNLTPLSLDGGASAATLDVDGQELRYANEAPRPTPFTWPGPSGTNMVRLSFVPLGSGLPVTVTKEGPWALFRLLQERGLQRIGQPDVFEAVVGAGGNTLRLRLRAGSVENPFDLRLLSGFTCPESL